MSTPTPQPPTDRPTPDASEGAAPAPAGSEGASTGAKTGGAQGSSAQGSSATPTDPTMADTQPIPAQTDSTKPGDSTPAGAAAGGKGGWKRPWRALKKIKWRRNPWVTVGAVVVVLIVVAALGYFAGLGPMSRLNTARGIEPPAKLAGLDRITDADIRGQLQLDQTRDALSRINDGKQATVEAYGDIDGKRMFVVIALRGKVDIDKTVKDSGATPDQVKVVGKSTCVESNDNLPTQCYRGSNTLTVIAQAANDGVGVDAVGPVADEAFAAMK